MRFQKNVPPSRSQLVTRLLPITRAGSKRVRSSTIPPSRPEQVIRSSPTTPTSPKQVSRRSPLVPQVPIRLVDHHPQRLRVPNRSIIHHRLHPQVPNRSVGHNLLILLVQGRSLSNTHASCCILKYIAITDLSYIELAIPNLLSQARTVTTREFVLLFRSNVQM